MPIASEKASDQAIPSTFSYFKVHSSDRAREPAAPEKASRCGGKSEAEATLPTNQRPYVNINIKKATRTSTTTVGNATRLIRLHRVEVALPPMLSEDRI